MSKNEVFSFEHGTSIRDACLISRLKVRINYTSTRCHVAYLGLHTYVFTHLEFSNSIMAIRSDENRSNVQNIEILHVKKDNIGLMEIRYL